MSDRAATSFFEQHRGSCRLRLIPRNTVGLKRGPKADTLWCWNYDSRPSAILSVSEIIIQTEDGRRYRQERATSPVPAAPVAPAVRLFACPWSAQEVAEAYVVRDASGFPINYLYFCGDEQRRSSTGRMTKDEARRIAANIARPPDLLGAEMTKAPSADAGRA